MMKKKIRAFIATGILAVAMAGNMDVLASSPQAILSRGTIKLSDGGMTICAADIQYLETEAESLLGEASLNDVIALAVEDGRALAQGQSRSNNIKSKGAIRYADDTVVIDSSDLRYLADEIDVLEYSYKATVMEALNRMGTYYSSADGTITHDSASNAVPLGSASALSLNHLYQGILKSQSVDHLTGISAAVSNNLSVGTAAWVNGRLIVGNGADNQAYYNQGFADGYAQVMNNLTPQYVYHVHTGDSVNGGGCYGEKVEETVTCVHEFAYDELEPDGSHKCYGKYEGTYCDMYPDRLAWNVSEEAFAAGNRGPGTHDITIGGYYVLNCGKTDKTIESVTFVFP